MTLLLAWSASGLPAQASYLDAVDAYAAKDFVTARQSFERMARVGHARSQFNLAVMQLKGEGGPETQQEALAWLTIAAEAGDKLAAETLQLPQLSGVSIDAAIVAELRSRHGWEASVSEIFPSTPPPSRKPSQEEVKGKPVYPLEARRAGQEGFVLLDIQLGPDGEIRDPRVQMAYNGDVFSVPTMRSAQSMRIRSGSSSRSFRSVIPFTYRLREEETYGFRRGTLAGICEAGDKGDAEAMYGCGVILVSDDRARGRLAETQALQQQRGRRLLARAAMVSHPDGALILGSLLTSSDEAPRRNEAIHWLEIAAMAGSDPAKVRTISGWLSEDRPSERRWTRIRNWLDALESSSDHYVLKHVARLRLAITRDGIGDPAKALETIRRTADRLTFDPECLEIEALALSRLGRFEEAIARQQAAITMATDYGWDLTSMQQKLTAYESGRTSP